MHAHDQPSAAVYIVERGSGLPREMCEPANHVRSDNVPKLPSGRRFRQQQCCYEEVNLLLGRGSRQDVPRRMISRGIGHDFIKLFSSQRVGRGRSKRSMIERAQATRGCPRRPAATTPTHAAAT